MSDETPGPIIDHITDPTRTLQSGSSICRMCGGHFGHVWYLCDACAQNPRRTYDRLIVVTRALHLAELEAAEPRQFHSMPDGTSIPTNWRCRICGAEGEIKHALPHESSCPFSIPTYEEIDAADRFSSDCGQDDRLTFEQEVERQAMERDRNSSIGVSEFKAITILSARIRQPRGTGVKRTPKDARRARTRSTS